MTPQQFVAKWSRSELSERAASQEHFIDLCRLLGQPTPAEHDATGAEYTFEKSISVSGSASRASKGDGGFADVWWRGKFALEYKRKDKYRDLKDAYRQLLQYREALENPPLLIVSDIARTEIHTNFTGTAKIVHTIPLEGIPGSIDVLRRVFTEPDWFRPNVTTAKVTEEIAGQFASLAEALRRRGHEPHAAAHFLMKCMFCLFAEDVDLLPDKLFRRLLTRAHDQPEKFEGLADGLFAAMRSGGDFGADPIAWFNGGLFDERPALGLNSSDIGTLLLASRQDWSAVEPAIFGTLFERSLDPDTRAQIGAHYTSKDDILLVVEPVIMLPLQAEWQKVKETVEKQVARKITSLAGAGVDREKKTARDTAREANKTISRALLSFQGKLSHIRILDPACGSGNFLYVALNCLLELEKKIITFSARPDIAMSLLPRVRPTQLHGIELNPYAAELAQVVIWIGYLQWMLNNGFNTPRNPILENLQTIENRDAIVEAGANVKATAATWPEADFIIGNPPFLGSKLFRKNGLSDEYVESMFAAYSLNGKPIIPRTSDLCCYWFEQARRVIEKNKHVRAGLLATQGIRGGDNRTVLERIKETGDIFMAWSDKEWVLDGAAVNISIVGFGNGVQDAPVLDGCAVATVNADLTSEADTATAKPLPENKGIAYMGDTKGGAFDISFAEAADLLRMPNPHGRPNSDVVRPWVNGLDITRRPRVMFIVDFGCDMPEADASLYERPFALVEQRVRAERVKNRRESYAKRWWIHVEPRPAMRSKLPKDRYIATPNLTKHRLFLPLPSTTLPDHQLIMFVRSDDYFLGVLQSSAHELWALRMGTRLEDRPRYTPSSCFETFPLPWPPGKEPVVEGAAGHELYAAIGVGAKELNELRERWLNPPELVEPIAAAVDREDGFGDVPAEARGLVRQSAIMARAAGHPLLKKRTLTNLYNQRPTWLKLAHEKLDRAVLAAYAAVDPAGGWVADWAEVWVESGAGQALAAGHALAGRRGEVDQRVLGNLLRMNGERAGK